MSQKGTLRRPAARCFRTQRDGRRGLDSVVPAGLLRQRRLAPLSGILSIAWCSCFVSLEQALSDGAFFFGIAASPRSRAGLSGPPRGDYPPDPSIHVALSVGIISLKLEIKERLTV